MNEHQITEPGEAEATLRLIAKLPPPDGLAERVQSRLKQSSLKTDRLKISQPNAHVLQWPARQSSAASWARTAAAAAIVTVVAGGAWQIGAHIVPAGSNATAPVVNVHPAGGFSNAGAMRTPDTLNGPVLKQPPAAAQDSKPEAKQTPKKKPEPAKKSAAKAKPS